MIEPFKIAVLAQIAEDAAEAEAEIRLHLERNHPEVGKCPQRRAQAEEWVCMAEAGEWTVE